MQIAGISTVLLSALLCLLWLRREEVQGENGGGSKQENIGWN